jgi:hypothetical protein
VRASARCNVRPGENFVHQPLVCWRFPLAAKPVARYKIGLMHRPSRHERLIAAAICAAFALQCCGYALLLPPWEGFDETAHFSYVSLLADRWEIPDFRTTPLDARIETGTIGLPQRYGANGSRTYKEFFSEQSPAQRQAAAKRYWRQPMWPEYRPRGNPNWQGQHPPLFYLLLTMPYRAMAGQSLGVQLTILRLVAVAMACGSALFWWLTLSHLRDRDSRLLWLAGGATILALPSCWFDLGRLGNDALAACCLAAVVYFLLRATESGTWRDHIWLAIACACGLLTKAFFVPVTAGAVLYLAVSGVRRRGWQKTSLQCALAFLLIGLIAGWWFALFAARYGAPLGSLETWQAARQGAFPGGELAPAAFVRATMRGAAAFVATFLWSGTWSWVRRPDGHYLAMLPLLLLWLYGTWRSWRERPDRDMRRLLVVALLLLTPLLCGFASHIVLRVRMTGVGSGTAGYYLFFAWPLVGVLLAGFWSCFQTRSGRWLAAIALASAVGMEWSGLWFCAQVYAGIIEKTGHTPFGLGGALPTSGNLALVAERLDLLCFPRTAILYLALALLIKIALWIGLARLVGAIPQSRSTDARPGRSWGRRSIGAAHFGRSADSRSEADAAGRPGQPP